MWIIFGSKVPTRKPGGGPTAALWNAGAYAGKPLILAAVSFAAYLIGAFLEIDPLRMWEHGGRPKWITDILNVIKNRMGMGRLRVYPITQAARRDVEAFAGDSLKLSIAGLMEKVMKEENQLATRLQAANADLFNRYDRTLGESSFRINITPPLLVLALLVIQGSQAALPIKITLILVSLGLSLMLFRQGVRKVIQSRDVMFQALTIGIVQSTYLTRRQEEEVEKSIANTPIEV